MNPFDNPPESRQAPASDSVYVAAVKPYAAVSPSDRQPLARVRYTNGTTFIGHDLLRHVDLHRETGRPVDYWLGIDRLARQVVDQIEGLVRDGTVPQVTCFSELHSRIDANVGWSPEIDTLPPEDWAAVQWRVTDILRTG
ncbi:hypothetical protein [Mycolicibacterium goodii]|uniref:hypothetical protein n=1 Tax=Mycolicibacterium goodii TaxID=134601 RepID=UPI00093C10DA|nr:hypothetical protein [Mycolicibacterium goodii]MBU8841533.1 hypothetical protein [Mycolicibacterium goodii]OKH63608.1 hypothetical protein EB74_12680 [Mycobacterium sp. SWH-M5]